MTAILHLLALAAFIPTLAVCLAAVVSSYLLAVTLYRLLSLYVLKTDVYAAYPSPKHASRRWWWLVGDAPYSDEVKVGQSIVNWNRELNTDAFVVRMLFYAPRLALVDAKAIHYLFCSANNYSYPKPSFLRLQVDKMMGRGLLSAEGNVHKRQKRRLQAAFSVSAIRALTPIFFRHANAFADHLGSLVDRTAGPSKEPFIESQSDFCARMSKAHMPAIDVMHWFGRLTLDVIGDAGFGHLFHAVTRPADQQTDSIVTSCHIMMSSITDVSWSEIILLGLARIPFLHWIDHIPSPARRRISQAHKALDKAGLYIIRRNRQQILQEQGEKAHLLECDEAATSGKRRAKPKDLLYLMMQDNMASHVRQEERLTDAELLGQITTLLHAGHETTSMLLTFFIHVISQEKHAHIVEQLRKEIDEHFAGRDELGYDALMAMPYLDKCTKEILRLYSPADKTLREATKDDLIPLAKPIKLANGKGMCDYVPIKRGQVIVIGVEAVNRSKDIWGETADEYEPERWDSLPKNAKENGFPRHVLSLLEGPRGCIGASFALAEFKAVVCVLLKSFQFHSMGLEIERQHTVLMRPRVVEQRELGYQMPVWISRV